MRESNELGLFAYPMLNIIIRNEIFTSREQLSVLPIRECKFFQSKELFDLITALLQLLSMGSAKEYKN